MDVAPGLIHAVNQVLLEVGATLTGKGQFEQWIWDLEAVTAK